MCVSELCANSSHLVVWLSQEQVLLLFVLSHPGWREGNCTLKAVFDKRTKSLRQLNAPCGPSQCQGENSVFSHENSTSGMCTISSAAAPVPPLCHCAS